MSDKDARGSGIVVSAWLALSCLLTWFAVHNLSSPGLYYDEAVFAGMAKDFVSGTVHGQHMPGTQTVRLFGRPFPLCVQWYLGAVKTWTIVPGFFIFGPSIKVLRLTALFWCLVGLLFFMLWTRRLMGLRASLIAALMLGTDPSFFLISIMDWGSVVPSFMCRFCGSYLFVLWWRENLNCCRCRISNG